MDYCKFTKKQGEYIVRAKNSWLNVAEGGKRAGKNVINILAWALKLELHKDKLHLAAGVSIATAKLNIIDSNGFGLKFWFAGRCREGKYQQRDALYIGTLTGEKIVLISGGGKEGDEKLIKGNTYGTVYVTEVNECARSFVNEVFDRTLSSTDRQIYFDINPKNPSHWFYSDILDVHMQRNKELKNYGLNYEHFNIFDNLSIGNQKLKTILSTYNKKSVWYKRDILGIRVAMQGTIYDMFQDDVHVVKTIDRDYDNYYVSIDYGTYNACVFGLYAIFQGKHYKVKEYYYDGRTNERQKTDEQYAEDLEKFIGDFKIRGIIIDPSASSFITAIKKRGKWTVMKAKNEVLVGIKRVAEALEQEEIYINDCCTQTILEFSAYIWDIKACEKGEDKPLKQFDHAMDELRYYVNTIMHTRSIRFFQK